MPSIGMVGEQPAEGQRELVGGAAGVGLDPPGALQLLAVEHAEDGVGVADVDGEQHHGRSSPMSSAGAEWVSAPTAR